MRIIPTKRTQDTYTISLFNKVSLYTKEMITFFFLFVLLILHTLEEGQKIEWIINLLNTH